MCIPPCTLTHATMALPRPWGAHRMGGSEPSAVSGVTGSGGVDEAVVQSLASVSELAWRRAGQGT